MFGYRVAVGERVSGKEGVEGSSLVRSRSSGGNKFRLARRPSCSIGEDRDDGEMLYMSKRVLSRLWSICDCRVSVDCWNRDPLFRSETASCARILLQCRILEASSSREIEVMLVERRWVRDRVSMSWTDVMARLTLTSRVWHWWTRCCKDCSAWLYSVRLRRFCYKQRGS